jgi:hypothetical protein
MKIFLERALFNKKLKRLPQFYFSTYGYANNLPGLFGYLSFNNAARLGYGVLNGAVQRFPAEPRPQGG